jgi:hypothetical protein
MPNKHDFAMQEKSKSAKNGTARLFLTHRIVALAHLAGKVFCKIISVSCN